MTHMTKDFYLELIKNLQNAPIRRKQYDWKIGQVYEKSFHRRGNMEGNKQTKIMKRS